MDAATLELNEAEHMPPPQPERVGYVIPSGARDGVRPCVGAGSRP
jgi:hypothetical protein